MKSACSEPMKGFRMQKQLILCLMVCGLLLGASCGKTDQKPVTVLEFWHTHNVQETKTLEELVRRYEASNPDVQIKLTAVDFWQAFDKINAAGKEKHLPDIFRCEITWLPAFVKSGFLQSLDVRINQGDRVDFLEAPFKSCQYQGKIWGLPQVTDCLALLYNKRMVPEPPATFEALIQAAKPHTNLANGRYGFVLSNRDAYYLLPFIWGFGGDLIQSNGKVVINSPESVQALQFVLDLNRLHKVVPPTTDISQSNEYEFIIKGFKEGKFAMIFSGPWATADILTGLQFSHDPGNLGIAKIPAGPVGSGSPVGGHNYAISASCSRPDAAYNFIHYLSLPAQQKEFALQNNLLPTRRSTYLDEDVKKNALLQGFYEQIQTARNRPIIADGHKLLGELNVQYQLVLMNGKDPAEALDMVARQWSSLFIAP